MSPGAEEGCGDWASAAATGRKKAAQRARDFIAKILASGSGTGKRASRAGYFELVAIEERWAGRRAFVSLCLAPTARLRCTSGHD